MLMRQLGRFGILLIQRRPFRGSLTCDALPVTPRFPGSGGRRTHPSFEKWTARGSADRDHLNLYSNFNDIRVRNSPRVGRLQHEVRRALIAAG